MFHKKRKKVDYIKGFLGLLLIMFYGWVIISFWQDIDYFHFKSGIGGNPQQGYQDNYD